MDLHYLKPCLDSEENPKQTEKTKEQQKATSPSKKKRLQLGSIPLLNRTKQNLTENQNPVNSYTNKA